MAACAAAVADAAAEGPGSLVQVYAVLRWLQVPACHRNKNNLGRAVTPLKESQRTDTSQEPETQAA